MKDNVKTGHTAFRKPNTKHRAMAFVLALLMAFTPVGSYLPTPLAGGRAGLSPALTAEAREGDSSGSASSAETAASSAAEQKVELEATFYSASLPARFAEKYIWEETSFE